MVEAVMRSRGFIDQIVVFSLTFIAYAVLHASRKTFANVKPTVVDIWTPSQINSSTISLFPHEIWDKHNLFANKNDSLIFIGVLDCIFMVTYSVGLFVNGWLGDRLEHRTILTIGLSSSAITIFFFGVVTEWLEFYNVYFYSFLWLLNGFFQSAVWPSSVAVMNIWFEKYRGFIIGIWSSNASVGNILADLYVGAVVGYGYHYTFLVTSTVQLCIAVLVFIGIVSKKKVSTPDERIQSPEDDQINHEVDIPGTNDQLPLLGRNGDSLPFLRILLIKEVILCALAYACIKLVNYSLFFWLTYYLSDKFHWSNSDASTFSVWYDIGGILGGITTGILLDCLKQKPLRDFVNISFSMLAVPALLCYRYMPADPKWLNGFVMSIAGFFVGGCAIVLSAIIVGDISNLPMLIGYRSESTIAGIIDGTGSAGASAGQLFVPFLSSHFGWSSTFYLFITCMVLTSVFLIPISIKNCRRSPEQAAVPIESD